MLFTNEEHRFFYFTGGIMSEETIEVQEQTSSTITAPKSIFVCWNDAIKQMFAYKERTSRYEFWAFQSVSLVIFLLLVLCGQFFEEAKIVVDIFALYFLLPATSICVRRLHDLGMSGWWCLPAILLSLLLLVLWNFGYSFNLSPLLFATSIYSTFLYWILCGRGMAADNKYGVKIDEPAESNLDSRAFMCFMFAFIIGLWVIFITHIW